MVTTASMSFYEIYNLYQSMAQQHYSNYSIYGLPQLATIYYSSTTFSWVC